MSQRNKRRGNMRNKNYMTAEYIRYIATESLSFESNVLWQA